MPGCRCAVHSIGDWVVKSGGIWFGLFHHSIFLSQFRLCGLFGLSFLSNVYTGCPVVRFLRNIFRSDFLLLIGARSGLWIVLAVFDFFLPGFWVTLITFSATFSDMASIWMTVSVTLSPAFDCLYLSKICSVSLSSSVKNTCSSSDTPADWTLTSIGCVSTSARIFRTNFSVGSISIRDR